MVTATGPADIAVAFGQILRGVGLNVPTSCTNTYAEALCATGITDRDTTYWAGRATLVRHPEDIALYDRAFAVFFEQLRSATDDGPPETVSVTIAVDTDESEDGTGDGDNDPSDDVIELRFSTTEILRNKDFASYTSDELTQAHELMSHLRLVGAPRDSLRRGPTRRITSRPDIRRTVRSAIRAGGEPIERHFSAPTPRLRRLVLLLDVSGSMEPYARALLRFVHAAVAGRQKVEAFTMGTRLTRITRELTSRDPDIALRAAGRARRRLERRHAPRRRPARVQRPVGCARSRPQFDRRDPVRRLGSGRPRRAERTDAAPAPGDPSPDLGQPAQGHAGLRTARPGDGRRASARGPFRRGPLGGRDGGTDRGDLRAMTASSVVVTPVPGTGVTEWS